MKTKKLILFCILNLFFNSSWAQIVITEIHFDTPYEEQNLHDRAYHHIGEFIELYNYSDQDILLKNWSITDYIGKFQFPDDAVILSGDFLIVAYRQTGQVERTSVIPGLSNNDYFSQIFPNTVGQENKIIYQDKIILRNLVETLRLHIGNIGTTDCHNFKIEERMFGKYGTLPTLYYSQEATNNPQNFDFYSFSTSIQLDSSGNFYTGSPTPLYSDYVPPIQDFETIPSVLDALYTNYNYITWEEYSDEILTNTCPLVISIIEQTSSEIYSDDGLCFNYDSSGNNVSIIACNPDDEVPTSSTEYTASEIDEIDSKIILHPNPTYSIINVSWDSTVNGKIVEMQVSNSSGVNINTTPINATQSGTSVDLIYYPTGIYIVKFILNTGQFISRNVIKI